MAIDKLKARHQLVINTVQQVCEEQFGFANPYLSQIQNVVAFENSILQLFDKIYDAR